MSPENWMTAVTCAIAVLAWLRVALVLLSRHHPRAAGMVTYPLRLAWFKLTGRMPRYRWRPMDGGAPLTDRDAAVFLASARFYRDKGTTVPEPDRTRGQR